MGILEALEIEKVTPVEHGVYICIDAQKKVFELVRVEDLPISLNSGETMCLGDALEQLRANISELKEKHNALINALMKEVE